MRTTVLEAQKSNQNLQATAARLRVAKELTNEGVGNFRALRPLAGGLDGQELLQSDQRAAAVGSGADHLDSFEKNLRMIKLTQRSTQQFVTTILVSTLALIPKQKIDTLSMTQSM